MNLSLFLSLFLDTLDVMNDILLVEMYGIYIYIYIYGMYVKYQREKPLCVCVVPFSWDTVVGVCRGYIPNGMSQITPEKRYYSVL